MKETYPATPVRWMITQATGETVEIPYNGPHTVTEDAEDIRIILAADHDNRLEVATPLRTGYVSTGTTVRLETENCTITIQDM